MPNPIFLVTTRKANGAANANLHSWGLLVGERDHYSSLLALLEPTHTYADILREGEWCVNFPSVEHYPQCFGTIHFLAKGFGFCVLKGDARVSSCQTVFVGDRMSDTCTSRRRKGDPYHRE